MLTRSFIALVHTIFFNILFIGALKKEGENCETGFAPGSKFMKWECEPGLVCKTRFPNLADAAKICKADNNNAGILPRFWPCLCEL